MSYVRIWTHCVWGTKRRRPYLVNPVKAVILKHIKENAKNKGIYIDFINSHLNHVHAIISLGTDQP